MQPKIIKRNSRFIGRECELKAIEEFVQRQEASIIIVHGRRRVGKTELVEQAFRERNLLKFEGIQGQPESAQRKHFLRELARYAQDPTILEHSSNDWITVFTLLGKYIREGVWTVYLEELQWLANYKDNLISELKYIWDNDWRHNSDLRLVLCGSSPSFFQTTVLKSRALYNRATIELPVFEFSIKEASEFYGASSRRELFDAYLTVGGIPEYLREIQGNDSVYQKISKKSFVPGAFFLYEFERIFVSSLAENPRCRQILEHLGSVSQCSRNELIAATGAPSGATMTRILDELIECQFVEKLTPVSLRQSAKIIRYRIRDYFLAFYFKFIQPRIHQIESRQYDAVPSSAVSFEEYRRWLGLSFERFCRQNQSRIAQILGFSGVEYLAAPLYNRKSLSDGLGYQVDLAFKRRDRVLSLCEIKYTDSPIGIEVIQSMEQKITRIKIPDRYSVQRVLITAAGISNDLKNRGYFDRVIGLEEL